MIICSRCKENYPQYEGNFYHDKYTITGFCYSCKNCKDTQTKISRGYLPKPYKFKDISDKETKVITNVLNSFSDKLQMSIQKSWIEIKQQLYGQ